jgi:hypothetical protein
VTAADKEAWKKEWIGARAAPTTFLSKIQVGNRKKQVRPKLYSSEPNQNSFAPNQNDFAPN